MQFSIAHVILLFLGTAQALALGESTTNQNLIARATSGKAAVCAVPAAKDGWKLYKGESLTQLKKTQHKPNSKTAKRSRPSSTLEDGPKKLAMYYNTKGVSLAQLGNLGPSFSAGGCAGVIVEYDDFVFAAHLQPNEEDAEAIIFGKVIRGITDAAPAKTPASFTVQITAADQKTADTIKDAIQEILKGAKVTVKVAGKKDGGASSSA